MPKLIEKPIGISREDVEKAPPLVSRKFFLGATGLSEKEVRLMAQDGDIRRLPVGVSGDRHKYYKADIMRICGYIKVEVKHGE